MRQFTTVNSLRDEEKEINFPPETNKKKLESFWNWIIAFAFSDESRIETYRSEFQLEVEDLIQYWIVSSIFFESHRH